MMEDLEIYYSSLSSPHIIDCKCSRWSTDNYSITIETWLTKSQLKTLRDNITPGAAGELYKILGMPTYYDQTWNGSNTIKIAGNASSYLGQGRRSDKIIYVKSISDSPIAGDKGWIFCKIEGYISGSTL